MSGSASKKDRLVLWHRPCWMKNAHLVVMQFVVQLNTQYGSGWFGNAMMSFLGARNPRVCGSFRFRRYVVAPRHARWDEMLWFSSVRCWYTNQYSRCTV